MPGTVKWTATFAGHPDHLAAQLYDSKGNIAASVPIPCDPPVGCPFPIDNLQWGTYKAAIVNAGDRYYYVAGQPLITIPNDAAHATSIQLSQSTPQVDIVISVQA